MFADDEAEIPSQSKLCLALSNQTSIDQYKVMYGFPDLKFEDHTYHIRVKHTLYGDMLLGRLFQIDGVLHACAGVIETSSRKRKTMTVLAYAPGSATLELIPWGSRVNVEDIAPKFCDVVTSKELLKFSTVGYLDRTFKNQYFGAISRV